MLHYLFNFFFPFLALFAAGASIADIGTGGGDGADGGGDSGGGEGDGGDDGSTDDASADGAEEGDLPHFDDEAEAEEGADDIITDPDAQVDVDGRKVSAKDKKLIDLAKKAGPEALKRQKQLIYAEQRLLKAIPGGINAAIELAQTVEELGGVEGIEDLRSQVEASSADADLFANNPAKWVETGFEENPDSALKSFAHSLDYVSEKHPEHYDHLMAKVIVNDLGALDVREMFNALNSIKDNPRAKELAKQLADYYNSRVETSRKAPEKKPDTQSKQLTEREKKIEEREMSNKFTEVNREVFPQLKTSVTKALQAEAKQNGIDLAKLSKEYPGEWRDLVNDIHQRIMKAVIKDKRFVEKHYALVKSGDLKRAAAAVNQKHDRIIESTDLVQKALSERGLFRKKASGADKDKGKDKTRAAGGNGNAEQGWKTVSAKPANGLIDWQKSTPKMTLDGKYILNDGTKVFVKY